MKSLLRGALVHGPLLAVAVLLHAVPAGAVEPPAGDTVIAAIQALYDAYRRPGGRDAQVDEQVAARIEAARPAVLKDLRQLRHQSVVRETQTLLAAYPAFARAQASDEFAMHAAWFTSKTNQVLSALEETARHGSVSDARVSAGAYNLIVAVRLMAMRRLGDIIPPLQAPEEQVARVVLSALQTNYELAGAKGFDADAGGGSVDTSASGKLSRRGQSESEVVRVTRAAMARMLELGYTQVSDAQRGAGRITNV